MPRKATTKKVINDDSGDDVQVDIVEKKSDKKQVEKQVEKQNWDELSNEADEVNEFNEVHSDDESNESENNDDNRGHIYRHVHDHEQQHYPRKQQHNTKYTNSAINFDYKQYAELDKPINEMNSKDILKVLIVRAYNDNQYQFCKTLKQTLRAMNLECNFPLPSLPQTQTINQNSGYSGFNGGRGNGKFRNENRHPYIKRDDRDF